MKGYQLADKAHGLQITYLTRKNSRDRLDKIADYVLRLYPKRSRSGARC